MTHQFDILTLFPQAIEPYLSSSILAKAQEKKILQFNVYQLRDWAKGPHRQVDDSTFGGGEGMVFKPEPLVEAIESLTPKYQKGRVIYLSPQGRVFNQKIAQELSQYEEILLICGRYEGIDERVIEGHVDEEISLGDFILCGGEIAALAIIEAIARLQPGVVGKENSVKEESFSRDLLEYPHYTRPQVFRGKKVPQLLLEGHHQKIADWRWQESIKRTLQKRPDLLEKVQLNEEEILYLKKLKKDLAR